MDLCGKRSFGPELIQRGTPHLQGLLPSICRGLTRVSKPLVERSFGASRRVLLCLTVRARDHKEETQRGERGQYSQSHDDLGSEDRWRASRSSWRGWALYISQPLEMNRDESRVYPRASGRCATGHSSELELMTF